MLRLLRIECSLHGANGQSTRLVRLFSDLLLAARPDTQITVRDLAGAPLPHLNGATFAAFAVPADQRSDAQRALVATSDTLVQELRDADVLVLGLPMYNFGVPSSLKAYIDHVMRAGVTFSYGATGPQGLLPNKRVFILGARGGNYAGTAMDMQLPYVRQVLAFMGMVDLQVVLAEGMARANLRDASIAAADAEVQALVKQLVPS